MADVVKVEHGNGDVSIGVEVDGTYIPFATVTAARIAGLKERAETLSDRYESDPDDKAVASALETLPIAATTPGKSKSSSATKSEGGES